MMLRGGAWQIKAPNGTRRKGVGPAAVGTAQFVTSKEAATIILKGGVENTVCSYVLRFFGRCRSRLARLEASAVLKL